MSPSLNPDSELDSLDRIIAQAQKDAAEDRTVVLGDLAVRTDRVCGHISSLPPEESRTFAARLKKLVGDLDVLTEQLARLSETSPDATGQGNAGSVA